MRCLAFTTKIKRCKKNCKFIFCNSHKLHWWTIIVTFATLAGLFQDAIKPLALKLIPQSKIEGIDFDSNTDFNILILHLNPDRNCEFENVDYENLLKRRFLKFKIENQINLDCKIYENPNCINSTKEAKAIGNKSNADLVVWGFYDEKCKDSIKVKLNYTVVNQNIKPKYKTKESKFKTITNLAQLSNGSFTRNQDQILYKTIGILFLVNNSFDDSLKLLEEIEDQCDFEVIFLKIIANFKKLELDLIDDIKNNKKYIDFSGKTKSQIIQKVEELQNQNTFCVEQLNNPVLEAVDVRGEDGVPELIEMIKNAISYFSINLSITEEYEIYRRYIGDDKINMIKSQIKHYQKELKALIKIRENILLEKKAGYNNK